MYNTALSFPPPAPSIAAAAAYTTGTSSNRQELSRRVAAVFVVSNGKQFPTINWSATTNTMVVMASATPNRTTPDNNSNPTVILTPPLSLPPPPPSSTHSSPKTPSSTPPTPSAVQRIISLFSNVRFGSDLTQFQMPPQFNIPKSQLQCYSESICCANRDMLSECVKPGTTPLQRMTSVVAWSVSTLRPLPFGFAPYNPVLGETHHMSRGDHLHVLLEQVSHHPPISALHGTDDRNNVDILWCHYPSSKFYGTSIESKIQGKRTLTLKDRGENYIMNSPTLFIRFMPFPAVDWVGDVNIQCKETGLRAELTYNSCSFFGFQRGGRHLKGKIIDSNTAKTVCEINGRWDGIVNAKDTTTGGGGVTNNVIYDAKQTITMLQAPVLLADHAKEVMKNESARIWAEVSKAIMGSDWDRANKGKRMIEETQRELAKQRKIKGETWVPKHFTLTHNKEDGWTCIPKAKQVHQSPIVFQLHP